MLKPKKNDIFRVEIGQVADNAMGVARIDGYVVFVKGALANEECLIRILKAGSSFGYGKIERILTPSPERIVSDCPYFPVCGGCDLRHMTYEEELRTKLRWASDALSRIGGCTVLPQEITGAYDHMKRNKAIYAVGGMAANRSPVFTGAEATTSSQRSAVCCSMSTATRQREQLYNG